MTLRGGFKVVTVGTSASIVLEANPNRRAIAVAPSIGGSSGALPKAVGTYVYHKVNNGGSNQVMASYTAPAGGSALITTVGAKTITGSSPSIQNFVLTGGNQVIISGTVSQGTPYVVWQALNAGDTHQLVATGSQSNGTLDLFINALLFSGTGGMTNPSLALGFGQSITLGQGIPINTGSGIPILTYDEFGTMLGLDIWAVAANAGTLVGILWGYDADDLFCPPGL